ncbi:MAG: NUDIX hydrolase [Micromonosporaceae bacterium]
MGDAPLHSVSVAAVIVDDEGRVLVTQRRDNGHWQPPGGVLEITEPIEDGLRREVYEEIGLAIEAERLTGAYKHVKRGIVALVFRARVVDGVPGPTDEVAAVDWWTPEMVSERMAETFAVRILDALGDGAPAVRAHDGARWLAPGSRSSHARTGGRTGA